MRAKCRALLFSSSRIVPQLNYLQYAIKAVEDFLSTMKPGTTVVVVPFAGTDHAKYKETCAGLFSNFGYQTLSLHEQDGSFALRDLNPDQLVICVPGGNTHRLRRDIHDWMGIIQRQYLRGTPLITVSAGSVLAGQSIKTTNDWPITSVPALNGLGFIPFNINPHFVSGKFPGQMGESREDRVADYFAEDQNLDPVVGLPEGSWIEVDGDNIWLRGFKPATVFLHDQKEPSIWTGDTIYG